MNQLFINNIVYFVGLTRSKCIAGVRYIWISIV